MRTAHRNVYDRVLAMVEKKKGGCRVFTGFVNDKGQPRVWDSGTSYPLVHRVVYEVEERALKKDEYLVRICGSQACVEPSHFIPRQYRKHT